MSRAIRLSRLHAINWYGYNDTLPVAGHLLLAGLTGSGKSVLMDLVQLVLVGSDRALFNRSATGTTSDRSLKSYVLCDTKREENGQAQYVRDKGAITYVAMEFTWPKDGRSETWGLRIEFRNAAEQQGRVTPFFCPGSLEKHHFLDAQRRPLEQADFRRLVEKERGGRLFETQEQYLRDMANEQHLNFNRSVLASLLPTAMSFTNLKSFDEFCRRFILPGDRLQVADVVSSYKNFQAYERDLRELHDQLRRLEEIHQHHTAQQQASRDRVVARWLAAELSRDLARTLLQELEGRLAGLRQTHAREAARIAELDELLQRGREELARLRALIGESRDGQLYLFLKSRNAELVRDIEKFKQVGQRLDGALRLRVRNARAWLAEVKTAPAAETVNFTGLEAAVKALEGCAADRSESCLVALAAEAELVKAALSRAIRPAREELDIARQNLGRLREEIGALQLGHLPMPTRLLNALNDALPFVNREPAAQTLCQLCEVTDEKWRPAIEVVFTRKFAVVVGEPHYARAVQLYHELREDSPQESLINPHKARPRPVLPGSLAEKIATTHPVAQAVVSQLFGDLICVEKREDLARHEKAIMPDGFMSAGAFVQRRRHYDNLPFVGESGLRKQLEVKRGQLRQWETMERQLRPKLEEVDRVNRRGSELIPEHATLADDLREAHALPRLEAELARNITQLNSIDRASFEERERDLVRREQEIGRHEAEQRPLLTSQLRGEITHLENQSASLSDQLAGAARQFERVQTEAGDLSIHAARLNQWRREVLTEYPALDAAARRFEKHESDAREQAAVRREKLVAARRELALAYRKFEDLPPESEDNAPWEKLRLQINEANIPDYQTKSASARKHWEGLFRTQVLAKLDRALREVRDLVVLLNTHLRAPIGNDRYQIEARPSPDFKVYRDLVSLNAQHVQDELFFASVSGELRDALEYFLKTLVDQPDSAEAVRLLDYRHYFDYDLLVGDARDAQARPVSVDRQSGKFSGGENQAPYFVAILASYLRAYNRHETRWQEPALALVPIDEAFSKLSPERIEDCVRALKQLNLQGVLSMSAGNIPFAFSQCDQLIIVSKHEERRGTRTLIRNVPVSIVRESAEGQTWMKDHA